MQSRIEERGNALILAIFLLIITIGLTVSSAEFLKAHKTKADVSFTLYGQASQFAQAGLTEATNWFRRQTVQPVTTFAPVLDNLATPPIVDTVDADVGLVREFQIRGTLWGRYEIWKQWDTDPDAERLSWRQNLQAKEISEQRGHPQAGAIWRIKSVGYVVNFQDGNVAYNQPPNEILATEMLESEISRIVLTPPGAAALAVGDGNSAVINAMGRIIGGGGGAGITYPSGSGTPNDGPAGDNRVTGLPGMSPIPDYDDSPEAVFGVSENDLRSMADIVVADMANFPVPVPQNKIVFVDHANVAFDAATPLLGTGIVYCVGKVALSQGSNSSFSGLLYANGNLVIREPSEIRGAVIATGNVTIQGSKEFATLRYDAGILDALRDSFSNYRFSGAIRRSIVRD